MPDNSPNETARTDYLVQCRRQRDLLAVGFKIVAVSGVRVKKPVGRVTILVGVSPGHGALRRILALEAVVSVERDGEVELLEENHA